MLSFAVSQEFLMAVSHTQLAEIPQQVDYMMKALLLLFFLACAAAYCDKACPIQNDYICVSRQGKCFYNIRNSCILEGINCYRKNRRLPDLTEASRGKCNATQVPTCNKIDTT